MTAPVLLAPGEGEPITRRPERDVTIKAALGQVTVTESRYASRERGPDPHVHWRHVDAFYVLDGEVESRAGEDVVRAGRGIFLAAPRGSRHGFRSAGPARAKVLTLHAPDAGFAASVRHE